MCLCVFMKKGLKNTMLGQIFKQKNFSHLNTFFSLEDSACVAIIVTNFFLLNYNSIFTYLQAWIHKKSCERDHNRKTLWDY